MKVIKRDGRVVEYDKEKIKIAISKANNEVISKEKANEKEIDEIIEYIEKLDRKRILVEDIQDIIEQQLMEIKKFQLAKKYIVYRYTRQLVRKQNTTDESILGIIREEDKSVVDSTKLILAKQRNYIAGEVSSDLTRRILLPEKITNAELNEVIVFNNSDFFIHRMIDSSVINLEDMLKNGIKINNIEFKNPKSFQEAINIILQIILIIGSNQYGYQYINLECLGKYLGKTYNLNEIKDGTELLLNLINTISRTNIQAPNVKLILNINNNEFIKENVLIIEEILNYISKNNLDSNLECIYILNKYNNTEEKEYFYLTKKCMGISQNIKVLKEEEIQKKIYCGFNQGSVTLNINKILNRVSNDINLFWKELESTLDLCKEALMCKHYALLGTMSGISPLHWQYGGISRLEEGENINKFLKNGKSSLTLKCNGFEELKEITKNILKTENDFNEFKTEIILKINTSIDKWKKETGINFILEEQIRKIINFSSICSRPI